MKYDLNKLNTYDFEHLVQSLCKNIIGSGTTSFGDGTDGGREAIYEGEAPFPSASEKWSGYWVIQAKFKSTEAKSDFDWIKIHLTKDLKKYQTRKSKVKHPENYLFFTNATLTGTANTGGRDKATLLEKEYQKKYKINNIKIISNDDIRDHLDNNRNVATAYAPFILPGDILSKLLELLEVKKSRKSRLNEIICRFLEFEFKEDIQSKLDHAGKLTSDKINLEKVFIDLHATSDGLFRPNQPKFINKIITTGNHIVKNKKSVESRFVLIAGPGYGKSTLTQFLTQIYRSYFLNSKDDKNVLPEVIEFISDYKDLIKIEPNWNRFPIRIILKDYANWLRNFDERNSSTGTSVLDYICFSINKKAQSGNITNDEIESLIKNLPCVFIFDGLDEVPASSNRIEVLTEINTFTDIFLRRIESDSIIIATTRPQGYSKEFDNTKYHHLLITDLEKEDCLDYLKRLLDNIIDDFSMREEKMKMLKSAFENIEISRLMKSPLQASIMAILVKSGGEPPRNKFDLFEDYYDIIFKREKQRNISRILSENPNYINEIHNKLGFYLQAASENETNPSASISISDFKVIIVEYLCTLGLEELEISKISQEIVEATTDRLVFISELEDEKIGFAIRSLQEYFAANGYIHNIADFEISNKIKKISTNSYWANTLIFAIGYISKNKRYLVSSIESICNELNGSSDDKHTKSLSSITKLGSWIALDILNEGIFRDNPNIENKFGNLIEHLFYLAPNSKHQDIAKLPKKLIEKWIHKYIQESLLKKKVNSTVWMILIYLFKRDGKVELIEKHFPSNIKEATLIIKLLIENEVYAPFVQKKFIELLSINSKSEFLSFFKGENQTIEFIEKVSSNPFNTETSKYILAEITFIISCSSRFDRTYHIRILNNLGFIFPKNILFTGANLFSPLQEIINIEFVEGYKYKIAKQKLIKRSELIPAFQKSKLSTPLMLNILKYVKSPNLNNLKNLDNHIQTLDDKYKREVIRHITWINSFLKYYYLNDIKNREPLGKISEELESIDEESFNKGTTNKILFKDKYSLTVKLSLGQLKNRLDEFITNYLIDNCDKRTYKEFFWLFDWAFHSLGTRDLEELKNDETFIEKFRTSTEIILEGSSTDIMCLQEIIYFFDTSSIKALLSSSKLNVNSFNLLKVNSRAIYSNPHTTYEIFDTICDLVRMQIICKDNAPYYKLLFNQIITIKDSLIPIDRLPFLEMLNYSSNPICEVYKSVLLIFDKNYSKKHLDIFKELIENNIKLFENDEFVFALFFAIDYAPNNEFIDNLLIILDEYVQPESESRVKLEKFIKVYIGNKPSGISVT